MDSYHILWRFSHGAEVHVEDDLELAGLPLAPVPSVRLNDVSKLPSRFTA